MSFILIEIVKANILVGILITISYFIEKYTGRNLLFNMFYYPKSINNARGAADFHAIIYFFVCLVALLWALHNTSEIPPGYSFWKWLLIMIPIVVAFQRFYYRYTAKDPHKKDGDWGQHQRKLKE